MNRHIRLSNSAQVEIPCKYHLLNFLQQAFQRALLLTLLSFQRVWKQLSLSLSPSVRANFPTHIRDQKQTCLISISSFLPSYIEFQVPMLNYLIREGLRIALPFVSSNAQFHSLKRRYSSVVHIHGDFDVIFHS